MMFQDVQRCKQMVEGGSGTKIRARLRCGMDHFEVGADFKMRNPRLQKEEE
jgi:hypothetical protein